MAIDDLMPQPPATGAGEAMPADTGEPTTDNALAIAGESLSAPAVAPNLGRLNKLIAWSDHKRTPNIATEVNVDTLSKIGQTATREYQIDAGSRSSWVEKTKDAMDLAMQIAKTKTTPWPNASNVIHPLTTVAALQFAARAVPAIIAGRNVVKGVVVGPDDGTPVLAPDGSPAVMPDQQTGQPAIGPDGRPQIMWNVPPGEKRRRAQRIGDHMSWQLLDEMEEWAEETDKLLHILPIAGCMFRKTYFDPAAGRNASVLANSMNVVINYWAKSVERAPRISEDIKLYPIEIEENERAELFLADTYGPAPGSNGDDDAPHEFIEQHRWWDLDDDGYPEPYIATVRKDTSKVVRILARFDPEGVMLSGERSNPIVRRIAPVHYYTKYDFIPNMEGGIYGVGFGQLLRPINDAINTSLNMMFDGEHKRIVGGGFIGKGLSMHSGAVKFKMGEYRPLNVPGSQIRDAIVHVDSPGASATLLTLLGILIESGKEIASVKDVLTGDSSLQTMQPTTLLALIEQGLKVFTAIYGRVHRAAKREYGKIARLNRLYMDEVSQYQVGEDWREINREDYQKGSGVAPYSDPAMVSDMQRLAKAGFLQGYQNDPMCDGMEIRRRIFDAASLENPDQLFAKQQGPTPDAIIAAAKMENESIKTRAAAINALSGAVLNLANADKAVGQTALAFVGQQFEILKAQLERLDQGGQQVQQGDAAPSPESASPAALPPVVTDGPLQ